VIRGTNSTQLIKIVAKSKNKAADELAKVAVDDKTALTPEVV